MSGPNSFACFNEILFSCTTKWMRTIPKPAVYHRSLYFSFADPTKTRRWSTGSFWKCWMFIIFQWIFSFQYKFSILTVYIDCYIQEFIQHKVSWDSKKANRQSKTKKRRFKDISRIKVQYVSRDLWGILQRP